MNTCRNGHAKTGPGTCLICRRASANRASKKYEKTEKGKAVKRKYGRSEKGKAAGRRYAQTDQGRWTRQYAHRRWLQDNHEELNERRRIKYALNTSAQKRKG